MSPPFGGAPPILLRAGPLSLWLDQGRGQVRWVTCGGREVLRSIYFALRDPRWTNVPGRIEGMVVDSGPARFRVRFRSAHEQGEVRFSWDGLVEGEPDGSLRFGMDGLAESTFRKNRVGLCVLHPLDEFVGQPCQVERADGSTVAGVFPRFVAPQQPFVGIRGMRFPVAAGLEAELRFEGDVFEMEDQRNWGDASFKTYSTPLALPFPAEVREGTRVSQTVSLRLVGEGRPRPVLVSSEGQARIEIDPAKTRPLPARGLGPGAGGPLSPVDRDLLLALRSDHVRFDLRPSLAGLPEAMASAMAASTALGAALHLAVFVGDDPEAELKALAAAAERLQPRVALWLLFREATRTTSYGLVAQARSFLAPFTPGARFGGGTDGFFVDLNRQRPSAAEFDQVSFAWSPQVHLPDDETIAENQASLPWIAESARAFVGTCPLALSPVTLEPRPAAARPAEPAPADPRLHARFGAAWAAAFLAAAAQGGFASLTLLEPAGARGVVCDGKGTPLYHVLADVADFGGGVVVEAAAEGKAGLGALVLRREAQLRTLVWNLRGSPGRARVLGLGRSARIQRLGESEQGDATAAPAAFRSRPAEVMRPGRDGYDLLLGPHEVVRLDTVHAD